MPRVYADGLTHPSSEVVREGTGSCGDYLCLRVPRPSADQMLANGSCTRIPRLSELAAKHHRAKLVSEREAGEGSRILTVLVDCPESLWELRDGGFSSGPCEHEKVWRRPSLSRRRKRPILDGAHLFTGGMSCMQWS